ncbi:hypothetical protein ACKI1I_24610 [Streptomyces turgidiscabies]|uniref:hypothetical protein n=1 Tax=Streptomyces TaxID=1883 RepID=UPI00076E6C7D|nr:MULTISPECIES: hypothetical protein [Streptomyces]MDX3499013.1 hypothetical protein [Streptomyces turgidiscabies]GAQ73462.1 hypothetical protein T45_05220 [Streptomyces turgidiscabies]
MPDARIGPIVHIWSTLDADAASGGVPRPDPRPLYVIGESATLPALVEAGSATRNATHVPHGGVRHARAESK